MGWGRESKRGGEEGGNSVSVLVCVNILSLTHSYQH